MYVKMIIVSIVLISCTLILLWLQISFIFYPQYQYHQYLWWTSFTLLLLTCLCHSSTTGSLWPADRPTLCPRGSPGHRSPPSPRSLSSTGRVPGSGMCTPAGRSLALWSPHQDCLQRIIMKPSLAQTVTCHLVWGAACMSWSCRMWTGCSSPGSCLTRQTGSKGAQTPGPGQRVICKYLHGY